MTEADIEVTPEETRALVAAGDAIVVDVREPSEWDAGRVAQTTHIPLGELSARAGELPPSATVIFVCRVGGRSLMAAQAFRAAGLDARSMAGGLIAWRDSGLPLTPDDGVVADH